MLVYRLDSSRSPLLPLCVSNVNRMVNICVRDSSIQLTTFQYGRGAWWPWHWSPLFSNTSMDRRLYSHRVQYNSSRSIAVMVLPNCFLLDASFTDFTINLIQPSFLVTSISLTWLRGVSYRTHVTCHDHLR